MDSISKVLVRVLPAFLLFAAGARADVCTGLFEKIEISPGLAALLADPKVQSRIMNFESDREPFASFYKDIESWLMLERRVGRDATTVVRLRAPGGEPFLRAFKRRKYKLKANIRVENPGEVLIEFELNSVNMTPSSAILDLQTLELAVVNRLFHSFSGEADALRKVTIEWKLGQKAPKGFGEHMLTLGFGKDPRFLSRCSLPDGIAIGMGSTLLGAAVSGGISVPADTAFFWGDDPYGRIVPWATVGGVATGGVVTYFTCRKPTKRGGRYQLTFVRAAKLDEVLGK